ncbi:MAG: hypothetical protein ACRD8U_03760, partial [Pyrinomonadaceae bacterium]
MTVKDKAPLSSWPRGFYAVSKSHIRHLFTDRIVKDLIQIGRSHDAWIVSSLSDDASDQLFAVNESGSVLRDISTSLPGVSVWKVYPARNGRYAWIFSENWQVYVVDANGHPLNGGTPLFSGMKFNGLD